MLHSSMDETECRTWWEENFPLSPPVGFLLRRIYPERWLRIHSLPNSKRYPETAEEYAEIHHRHELVATATLGEAANCYLIRGSWLSDDEYQKGWIFSDEDSEQPLRFEVSETIWSYSLHRELLREIADDEAENAVFISRETKRVYAPYDGGADLVFLNQQERDEMRQTYQAWLSAHPQGL